MNMKRKSIKIVIVKFITFVVLISFFYSSTSTYARSTKLQIDENIYDFDKGNHYVIGDNSPSALGAIGTLTINGDVKITSMIDSFPSYEVINGNATFSYAIKQEVLNRDEKEWNLIDDKSKKVNGLTMDSNILSGALILQTSLDGATWIEDVLMTDIFGKDANTNSFYTTKDVQLQNGCYYKVIVAYKMDRPAAGLEHDSCPAGGILCKPDAGLKHLILTRGQSAANMTKKGAALFHAAPV